MKQKNEWIKKSYDTYDTYTCSNCKSEIDGGLLRAYGCIGEEYDYCPECRVRMSGERNEEE